MTLDIAVFGSILLVVVTGGTIGVGLLVVGLQRQHTSQLTKALALQEEAYKVELRELDRYNAEERRRLQDEIADLRAEVSRLQAQRESDWDMLRRILASRGIEVPRTGPLVTVAGDYNVGGDAVGGNKEPR